MGQTQTGEIVICMGSSCFSRGNKYSLELIKKYLKKRGLEDTFRFKGSHCFGECEHGPVVIIDGIRYTEVQPDKITELMENHFANH